MFETWGRIVYRRRRLILVLSVACVAFAAVWGTGVFGRLQSAGGFTAPGSQSDREASLAARAFGRDAGDVVVLYTSPRADAASAATGTAITRTLDRLPHSRVESFATYASTRSPQFISASGRQTYALLELAGGSDAARIKSFDAIRHSLAVPGLTARTGGVIPTEEAINKQVTGDISRAETLSMPLLLLLLLVIFGSLAAASLPLAIGGIAILGSFTALRLLTLGTTVSIYSINITTILGLGLAIDYGLFMVGRFREELGRQDSVEAAVARTMATAGRTVAVSGITVATALASLMLFPEVFLRSMGYGGVATVLVDMLAAVTVLPALLAALGPRVNALRIRPLRIRRRRRGATASPAAASPAAPSPAAASPAAPSPAAVSASPAQPATESSGVWYRLASSVMRRPVAFVAVIVVVLLALGSPFLRISWGGTDARVLPAASAPRAVSQALQANFPGNASAPIEVLLTGPAAASPARLAAYTSRLAQVAGVTGAQVSGVHGDTARIDLRYGPDPLSFAARQIVTGVRAVAPPAGARAYVGGQTAQLVDELASLSATVPWMALTMAAATFVLLFLAFGSVLLPVKAIAANLLSLAATFGVVVWIFQFGHLSGLLGFTPTGTIDPSMPILMLAIIFGLSMDYEVFLLSRIRERYDQTADNTAAVASGLQRTGGVITSAALLLVIVVGAFSASGITFIKLMGVGMIVALIVDATIVRVLLVPATMRLLGRANWWAPGPLRRLYARYGIHEGDEPQGAAEPPGRPASRACKESVPRQVDERRRPVAGLHGDGVHPEPVIPVVVHLGDDDRSR